MKAIMRMMRMMQQMEGIDMDKKMRKNKKRMTAMMDSAQPRRKGKRRRK